MHKITVTEPVLRPDDGLMLGNGDLSVAVYQKPGALVFRLGKGDFWDERIDQSRDPLPAHIDELREAIEHHDIRCDGLTGETRIAGMTPRLAELCKPVPSTATPTPTPKPAVELYLHYLADPPGLKIRQTLEIEAGRIQIQCTWKFGLNLDISAVIHPEKNLLAVAWKMSGYQPENRYGGAFFGLPETFPVWASLYRENDITLEEMRRKHYLENRSDFFGCCNSERFAPLPPVKIQEENQPFPLFIQEGFPKTLYARLSGTECSAESKYGIVSVMPKQGALSGEFLVAVETDRIPEEDGQTYETTEQSALEDARKFWNRSSLHLADEELENLWYAALHAKRCVLKAGKIPPGLFLPASLDHYSLWHGDYHFNYNYQSNFLGDFESNHFDTGDAYFTGIAAHLALGRKIARESYDSMNGCFIQLSGYPFTLAQDPMGGLPLGRMAYMSGWVATYYFRRWDLSRDQAFLRQTAWPVLQEIADFYSDFLKPDANGVWHGFPSNQGEADFSKLGSTDQPQVMWHARYALRCAVQAAQILDEMPEKAARWREIEARLAVEYPCRKDLAAEFAGFDGGFESGDNPSFLQPGHRFYDWYAGQTPYRLLSLIYQKRWNADKNFEALKRAIARWLMPCGIPRALSLATHGSFGCWSEALAFAAIVPAMLVQSEGNVISLFPAWPLTKDAEFHRLRVPGGILVSAKLTGGKVTSTAFESADGKGTVQYRTPGGSLYESSLRPADKSVFLEDSSYPWCRQL